MKYFLADAVVVAAVVLDVRIAMNLFLTGAIAMAMAMAAAIFFKFWRESRDRLFLLFAASFLALATIRVALTLFAQLEMSNKTIYWIRFLSFALILFAIIDKNRTPTPRQPG